MFPAMHDSSNGFTNKWAPGCGGIREDDWTLQNSFIFSEATVKFLSLSHISWPSSQRRKPQNRALTSRNLESFIWCKKSNLTMALVMCLRQSPNSPKSPTLKTLGQKGTEKIKHRDSTLKTQKAFLSSALFFLIWIWGLVALLSSFCRTNTPTSEVS